MLMTRSQSRTSAAGVAATVAPAAASAWALAAVRFQTATLRPSPSRRPAIAAPMRPVPMMPMSIRPPSQGVRENGDGTPPGFRDLITLCARQGGGDHKMNAPRSEVCEGMRVDRDVAILVDDGLALRADVFRPIPEGRFPVLLTYGPY